ncbi:DUF3040 domain-containing protein [Corynebacterium pseudodiphtheriticum]|uniref:DUF3040 domain-containing protein n=1 Tax=Corynebacterium pseudodiphtheriticum TaxID=37637 RepID=UPI00047CDE9B|nr:DUF3040 domain-containing protein [Corynebacterium pseudodiphtheriticum]
MSLSEQEQQALRQIEESLLAEDPKFGSSVSEDDSSFTGFGEGGGITLRGVAVVGLVAVIGGAAAAQFSLWYIAISIVGFLVMFGAGVWMLRGDGNSSGQLSSASLTNTVSSPSARGKSSNAFKSSRGNDGKRTLGDKMEERFRSRFDEN